MADAERKRRVEHVHETKALGYGHFGTANYDETTHRWHFLRGGSVRGQALGQCSFQLLHEQDKYVDLPTAGNDVSAQKSTPRRPPRSNIIKRTPEIVEVFSNISSSDQVTNLQGATSQHLLGDVLAFGYARNPSGRGFRTILKPIVLFPSGRGGENVQIMSLGVGVIPSHDEAKIELNWNVPCIDNSLHGCWSHSADRVLQISCSTSQNRTHILVRKSSGTSVLRPSIQSRTAKSNGGHMFPNLYIRPNHFLTVPCSRTGGQPHADAAFNPFDPSMIAIVDVHGQWSTWGIRGKKSSFSRLSYLAKLLDHNSLHHTDPHVLPASETSDFDGWHRIYWLMNSNGVFDRLFVCNRASAAVFGVHGEFVDWVDMRLGPPSAKNYILQVKQGIRRKECIFVLTTFRLQIFRSWQPEDSLGAKKGPLTLMCSWNHFRDQSDRSLQMAIVELPKSTCVMLYSHKNIIAAVYQFCHGFPDLGIRTLGDPQSFQLPGTLHKRLDYLLDLKLIPIEFGADKGSPRQMKHGLIKLFACTSDAQLVEAVYRHEIGNLDPTIPGSEENFYLPLPIANSHQLQSTRFVSDDDLDDFIIDDQLDVEFEQDVEREVMHSLRGDAQFPSTSPSIRNWDSLLDYGPLQLSDRNRLPLCASLQRAFQPAKEVGDRLLSNQTLLQMLHDPQVVDIEDDSRAITEWVVRQRLSGSVTFQGTSAWATPETLETTSLVKLYDDYLDTYITPLFTGFSDRSRVNREKTVRHFASTAFFGSITLRSTNPSISETQTKPAHVQQDDPISSSQAPSLSPSSTPQSPQPAEELTVTRLRSYANFDQEVPPLLLPSSPPISTLLAHLPDSIEDDPAAYSFNDTNKRLLNELDQDAEQSLDPRERRKLRKQAAKRQRDLEKQAKISQEVQLQRSLLPSVTNWSLGSTLPVREVQSSQPAVPDSSQGQSQLGIPGLNMTQPERGAFGARPSVKRKGKDKGKRTAGF